MTDVVGNAKVRLNPTEASKFVQRMGSDPTFAEQVSKVLKTNSEEKIASFLRKNGFHVG